MVLRVRFVRVVSCRWVGILPGSREDKQRGEKKKMAKDARRSSPTNEEYGRKRGTGRKEKKRSAACARTMNMREREERIAQTSWRKGALGLHEEPGSSGDTY